MTTTDQDVRIGMCIIAHGSRVDSHLVSRLRAQLDVVVVVATSASATVGADLTLPNVGYGTAANAAFRTCLVPLDWWIVANDDLGIDDAGAAAMKARLAGLPRDVALWSFTGESSAIAPGDSLGGAERRAPHGALLAIRSDVFSRVRGFDPRFFLYSEEVDLWLRMPDGCTSGSEVAPYVHHSGGGSTGGRPAANFELGRSTGVLARKHGAAARATVRAALTTGSLLARRRRPIGAASFGVGYLAGLLVPQFELVAKRRFSAASHEVRRSIGWLGKQFDQPTDPATVSVVLCTYNGEPFLDAQLDSIRNQTIYPDEVVVGDDGSSDATLSIVARFARSVPFPVRVERWADRAGPGANFSRTMLLAQSDLVAFCDQDDVWCPDRLERQLALLRSHPSAALCFGDATLIDGSGAPITGTLWSRFGFEPTTTELAPDQLLESLLRGGLITGATMVARRAFLAQVAPIGSGWLHDAWIAVTACAADASVVVSREPVIQYRLHGGQQVGAPGVRKAPHPSLTSVSDLDCVIASYEELLARVNGWPGPTAAIGDKVAHLRARRRTDDVGILQRTAVVTHELRTRRYFRYSNGLRSAIADLIQNRS